MAMDASDIFAPLMMAPNMPIFVRCPLFQLNYTLLFGVCLIIGNIDLIQSSETDAIVIFAVGMGDGKMSSSTDRPVKQCQATTTRPYWREK